GVVQAQTLAVIRTVLPGAKSVPSVVATISRSFDSSTWKVPDPPSAHEPLIVFGGLGSGPTVPRPRTSEGPVSHELPTVAHFGARSVASNAAVWAPPPPPPVTLIVTSSVAEAAPSLTVRRNP